MSEIENVRQYWNILSRSVDLEFKDHWVDSNGNALDENLFSELAVFLSKFIIDIKVQVRVLEIGCGTGRILNQLANHLGETVSLWGIDFSQSQIDAAKQRLGNKVKLFTCDLMDFAKQTSDDEKFDLIFLHSVTQYFPSDEYFSTFLEVAHSLLKAGGSLAMLDCPISWYKDLMQRKPLGILQSSKALIKKIIRYDRKEMNENISGLVVKVPAFNGYWVDPDRMRQFALSRFVNFKMEYQQFQNKPVEYKKFRPNFICSIRIH